MGVGVAHLGRPEPACRVRTPQATGAGGAADESYAFSACVALLLLASLSHSESDTLKRLTPHTFSTS